MEGKGRASACFSWLNDDNPPELWHSTPVKQKHGPAKLDVSHQSVRTGLEMDSRTQQWAKSPTGFPSRTVCSPRSEETRRFPVSDLSSSTVQRQRTELQLLMAELKDREQELNVMAAAHRKQLHAWEQDRQRVLASEQRCSGLDDELQKRNEVMAVLTKRVIAVETREEEIQKELSAARLQLRELQQKQQHASQKCDDYQEKNQSLSSTIMALSAQVGALQVREEELSSMLKLKDKDVTEASAHVAHLTGRLQDLEAALAESRSRESKVLRESEENRRRYRDAKHDAARLKGTERAHVRIRVRCKNTNNNIQNSVFLFLFPFLFSLFPCLLVSFRFLASLFPFLVLFPWFVSLPCFVSLPPFLVPFLFSLFPFLVCSSLFPFDAVFCLR
ncbi:uncharacterized protein V6R79_018742 [Siganus canaliculatus]